MINNHECQVCGRHIHEESNKVPIEIEGQDLGFGHKRCVQYIETLLDRTEFFFGCMCRAADLARHYQILLDQAQTPQKSLAQQLDELLEEAGLQAYVHKPGCTMEPGCGCSPKDRASDELLDDIERQLQMIGVEHILGTD